MHDTWLSPQKATVALRPTAIFGPVAEQHLLEHGSSCMLPEVGTSEDG